MLELKCEQKFGIGSTYDYNQDIEKTLLQKIPAWVQSRCAIRRIIRSVSNLVKLNPMEACLLAWLLSKSSYDIQRISIESRTNLVEDEYDHKVLVFILMNAYYVKEFVCQSVSLAIDDDISAHIPQFKRKYSKFHPQKSLKSFMLGDINEIFQKWTSRTQKKARTDYNNMVDKILELSKTYNVSGPEDNRHADNHDKNKLGVPKKRRKGNKEESSYNDDDGKSHMYSALDKQKHNQYPNPSQRSNNQQNGFNFRMTNSQEPDFPPPLRQSLQAPISLNSRHNQEYMLNRRSTRNFLQSINHFDLIHNPSPDNNMFYSQSQASNHNLGFNLMQSQSKQLGSNKQASQNNSASFASMILGNSVSHNTRRADLRLRHTSSKDMMK